jgi:hypothetical protein
MTEQEQSHYHSDELVQHWAAAEPAGDYLAEPVPEDEQGR